MVLGLVQRFEIKYIMELTDNAPDVLGGKTTVFHRIDHISPAGVVAPRLGQHSGQCRIELHFFIHDELKTLKNGWGKKREKFEQAHESDLIIWNAANRFLHANLPEGTKSFKVSEWQKEFDELKAQSTGEYEELKTKRSEVKELQQIRKCIDIVEQAEQRTQEQTHQTPRRKKEDISL